MPIPIFIQKNSKTIKKNKNIHNISMCDNSYHWYRLKKYSSFNYKVA